MAELKAGEADWVEVTKIIIKTTIITVEIIIFTIKIHSKIVEGVATSVADIMVTLAAVVPTAEMPTPKVHRI